MSSHPTPRIIRPIFHVFRPWQYFDMKWQIVLILILTITRTAYTQTEVNLSNPSSCALDLALADLTCPENLPFYNPDIFNIAVTGVAGTSLGTDVFLSEVWLLLEHPWISDLNIQLRSPGGQTAVLVANAGGNADSFGDPALPNCSGAMRFELGACRSVADGIAPFTDDSYRAQDDFYIFNDEATNPNGTWQLLICDDLEDDIGTLEFVELRFAPLSCLPVSDLSILNQDTTAVTLSYDDTPGCGPAVVEVGLPGFSPGNGAGLGGGTQLFMVDCPPFTLTDLPESTVLEVYVRRNCSPGIYSGNSCPLTVTTSCDPAVLTGLENFETALVCPAVCTDSCQLPGEWQNVFYDDMNWLAASQNTPTTGTGPSTGFGGTGNYIYLEVNGSACASGAEAVLLGPCITLDKQGTDSCHVSFAYHMNGIHIGNLRAEVSDDGGLSWQTLWSRSGSQGNQWYRAYLSLASYADGSDLQLRFVGTKGGGVYGDIALDDIRLHGSISNGFPSQLLYVDSDNDGFGDLTTAFPSCLLTVPSGFAPNGDDCNDDNGSINPSAPETPCNNIDENCNASTIDDDSILPLPLLQGDTICGGDTATLRAITALDYTVFWYDTPDKSGGIIGVGPEFQPSIPDPNSPLRSTRTYYAEVTNFVCSSPSLVATEVLILPSPMGAVIEAPSACLGDTFNLASINIQDTLFTGAASTFHSNWPPSQTNQLISTNVVVDAPITAYYQLQNADGCLDIDSLLVSLKAQPTVVFLPADSFSLCRFAQDELEAIPSGGAGGYQFEWSSGLVTNTQPVTAGDVAGEQTVYALTVTDGASCSVVDSVLITTTISIDSLTVSTMPVSTCNGTDGSIAILPLNGLPPFAYQWRNEAGDTGSGSGFADTVFIENLPQNAYRVTITDASQSACEVSLSNIRVQGPGFQLSNVDLVPPTCAGFVDGSICLDISGNTGPLSITWSTGDTTECIEDLSAGDYNVTITNGDCTVSESYQLIAPDSLQNVVRQTMPTCVGDSDGSLRITTIGGTPNYTYDWEDSGTSLPIRRNIGVGDYIVEVQDANGCLLLDTIELIGPQPLTVDIDSVRFVSCTGLQDGLVRVRGIGGSPPYQYLWEDGSVAPLRTDLTFGSYPLTVTDFNSCTFTTVVFIAQPSPLQLSVASMSPPICVGDETGSITLAADGGTAPYTLAWPDGLETTNLTREGLGVGVYELVVTDANGCMSDTLTVDLEPISNLSIEASFVEPTCVGLPDGAINLTIGGEEPINYQWSTGATTDNLSAIVAGNYRLTITDARGCQADTTFELTATQVFGISSTVVQPSCFGVDDGIIDQSFTATGTPPFQFFWTDNSQHVDQMFLGPGDYQFTVTDAIGCSFTSDTFRIQYPEPLVFTQIEQGDLACAGDTTGYFEVLLDGGTTPYSYNWVGSGNTTNALYGLGAGDYRLLATDIRGCALDTLLELADPDAFTVVADLSLGNVCEASNNDILLATVQGGDAPYEYLWNTGEIGDRLTNPTPGDYLITATDVQGCTASFGTIKVQERVEPLILDSFNVEQVSCFGAGDASLTAFTSGGSGELRYHFTPTFIEETNTDSVRISGIPFDVSYSVTVTDLATGCEVSSELVEGVQPAPLVVQRDSFHLVTCFNGSDGAIFMSVEGGTTPYQFAWTDDEGTPLADTQNLLGAAPGIHHLLITDANNCQVSLSDTNIVSIGFPIVLADTMLQPIACRGDANGAIDVTVEGGKPPYNYNWSNGLNEEDLSGLTASSYTLTVTDEDDCEVVFADFVITEPATRIFITNEVDSISCADEADGRISLQVSGGGGPPYAYRWRREGVLLPSLQGPEAIGLIGANYTVSVIDTNDCVQQLNFNLIEPLALELEIVNEPLGADSLSVVVSGGREPFRYAWSSGDTTPTASELDDGTFFVTVTDAMGCTEVASFILTWVQQQVEVSGAYSLFPNPAAHQLNLRRLDSQLMEPFTWEIYATSGVLVQQGQSILNQSQYSWPALHMAAGTYWLRIRLESGEVARLPFVILQQ